KDASNQSILNEYLYSLSDSRRQFAATLNPLKIGDGNGRSSQGCGKNIRGGYGVLNRQIDSHAADRRHRVSRVADTQEPWAIPRAQTVDPYRQQLDVIPTLHFIHAITQ